MYLQQAEIRNFRGIRHLKVDFEDDSTVLIGENSWGKSSLLRALWMALGRGAVLCQLKKEDLYVPIRLLDEDPRKNPDSLQEGGKKDSAPERRDFSRPDGTRELYRERLDLSAGQKPRGDRAKRQDKAQGGGAPGEDSEYRGTDTYRASADRVQIDLIFSGSTLTDSAVRLPHLARFRNDDPDGMSRIHWRITGREEQGRFVTSHELISRSGKEAPWNEVKEAILELTELNPVLRMRDHRMNNAAGDDEERRDPSRLARPESFASVVREDLALSGPEMKRMLEDADSFARKYVASYSGPDLESPEQKHGSERDIVTRPVSIETLSSIRDPINQPGINKVKIITSMLAGVVFNSKGNRNIGAGASPIVIFEDIEARLHPSILLSLWSIMALAHVQKIVTTNSGDLLSAAPLRSVRRLYRPYYDTRSYKVASSALTDEDQRRISFHLRINRPMSFFARTWLLVEGETEIWIISQAAAIMGVSLQCEGVRPLEFAQCGLQPIMKVARQLGIAVYVLTDGDEAGAKYSASVLKFLGPRKGEHCLTTLPYLDIEHYLYACGYDDVYLRCSGIRGPRKGIGADKIIEQAIRRKSKPGMAVEVISEMQRRGSHGVPPLLSEMIMKVCALSRGDYI